MKNIKNIIILIMTTLLITGCKSDYEITVNKKTIEDKVNFTLKDDDYDKAILINDIFTLSNIQYNTKKELGSNIIDKIKNDVLEPGYNIDGAYVKTIDNNKYSFYFLYQDDLFANSYVLNNCFDNFYYDSTDDYYIINATGSFKCLIKDEVKISVKSKYRVIDNNADLVRGNEYIWKFNSDNNLDHELYIQVSKKYKAIKKDYSSLIILAIILVILIVYRFFIRKENFFIRNNNDV